jgi:TP901 family phage tail tape measure protein
MDGQARVSVYLELKNRLKTGLDQAKQYLNKNVQEFKGRLNSLKTSHINTFNAMRDQIPGFGNAMSTLGNPYVLLTAGLVALGGAMAKASSIANEFDQRMAKANGTAQETTQQLKVTKDRLGNMAANSNIKNAHESVPITYDVMLSSGLDKETSIKSIPTILKAAKAGQTDTETVARATAGVMNSTGIKDSNLIMDKMMMVKNKGNAEFADIANYLPKIIPAANNAGIALDDVGGSFAYLTSMGLKSEQAATGLENAFKTLADPQKAEKFKSIGVSFYDSAGKMKPMLSVAEELKTALTGLTDKQKATVLDSLGLDMESASVFSMLTADTLKLKDSIGGVTNATGELQRQVEATKTPLDSWNIVGNQIHEAWRQFGDVVNQVLSPIGTYVSEVFTSIQNGTNMFSPIIQGISAIFGGIWNIIAGIGGAIWSIIEPVVTWLKNSVILQDVFWLIGKIAGIIGSIISTIGAIISKVGDAIGWVFNNTIKPILDAIEWVYSKVKSLLGFDSSNSKVAEVQKGLESTLQDAKEKAPIVNMYSQSPNAKVKNVLDEQEKKQKNKDKPQAAMTGSSNTKVVNINKVSMIDGNFISNNAEFAAMSPRELERFLEELFQRMSINMARSYAI